MIIRSNFSQRPFTLVEHAGFQYLTVIQNGFQIGALALTSEGRYVQVNGVFVQFLSTQKVQHALRHEAKRRRASQAADCTGGDRETPPRVDGDCGR